jgi:heptosyltransferase-2
MSFSILVRGVNWIGDAVMTLPALRALRKAYPGATISLLAKPAVIPVFENNPDIDDIISYDKKFSGFMGKLRLARLLRKKEFSMALLLQNAFDAALIAWLARIPRRIGYNRDGRGFLLTDTVPFNGDDRKVHHIEYYLNLLDSAGIHANFEEPVIHLSLEERLHAREVLSELSRPILGINPGATFGSAKRWLPVRFAEVANWFRRDTGGGAVIFGSRNEAALAQEINKNIPEGKLFLAGKTSLRELAALIAECDIMLTNDSGPMHIACAVGTPTLAIFGSTDPKLTGPAGEGHNTIKKDFSCSPCFERSCPTKDLRCMYTVTAEEVFFKVKDMLPHKRAVFFDRDGTLCRDPDYLSDWKDFEIFPGIERLRELKDKGFLLIGITNQSGIARGLVKESFAKDVNAVFTGSHGFDDFYYCPHSPDDYCQCRKPSPGMLIKARLRHKIDLKRSFVVGDKDADMLAAKAVGATGILVTTGKQQTSPYADAITGNLGEAVKVILSYETA